MQASTSAPVPFRHSLCREHARGQKRLCALLRAQAEKLETSSGLVKAENGKSKNGTTDTIDLSIRPCAWDEVSNAEKTPAYLLDPKE